MANVIIERADGSQASVNEAAFKRHYPDVKYKVIGPEVPGTFELAGVPRPKRVRSKPKSKTAKSAPAAPLATVPAAEPAVPAPVTPEERPW